MKAIIVDDELAAREILSQLIGRFCPEVDIVASCHDLEEAVIEIKALKPDVVFLDVEMPKFAGYEIGQFFDKIDFNIIFITAYDKYAIKAFELSALDYLLKPVEIERLKETVEKAKKQVLLNSYKDKLMALSEDMKNSVKKYSYFDKGYTNYVNIDEIIGFEAQRSYTKMYLTNYRSILISKNTKTIETELMEFNDFIRIHRSWIINKKNIVKYSKSTNEIHLKEGILSKIARQCKPEFETILKNGEIDIVI